MIFYVIWQCPEMLHNKVRNKTILENKTWIGAIIAGLFVCTVWFANWLIAQYGIVPVGFGLYAPAGVYAAGVAFTLRDIVQRLLGRVAVVACILLGAGLSWLISPTFAIASGVAFLVSETCDLAVYTPLERKSLLGAMVLSNTVGAMVDSAIFLTLAFSSLAFFWGQVVGKLWTTVPVIVVLVLLRCIR